MTTERWKPIPGWPGYWASTEGRIKGRERIKNTRVMPSNRRNYLRINLWSIKEHKLISGLRVHRLIALAWLPHPANLKDFVCHLNDDTMDNRPSNLKWGDQSLNERHKQWKPCQCGREYDEHDEDGQAQTPGVPCAGYKRAAKSA